MIANLTRSAHTVRTSAPDDATARKLLADFETTTNNWLTQALPSLAASMKVAIEVYETFGGGMTAGNRPGMHPKTAEVGLMRSRISSSADNPRRTIPLRHARGEG